MIYLVISFAIAYFLGTIQVGYILGKLNGIDIRNYGSGNSGATNTLRVLGKKASFITFLGDALKGVFAVLIARFFVCPHLAALPAGWNPQTVMLIVGLGAVIGHDFPFHMNFKGGKGVSTTGGVLFAIHPLIAVGLLTIFIIAVALTRYVSLGSTLLMISIPFWLVFFFQWNTSMVVMGIALAALSIWRHRANIGRLIHGNESKLGQKVEIKK